MIREPWDQRLDETSAHHRLFVWWRDQVPRPPPSDPALASTFDWSSRAAAWDAHRSVPACLEDQAEAAVRALTETACLYSIRLLANARVNLSQELSPKDVVALVRGVVQIQAILVTAFASRPGADQNAEAERFADALPPEKYREFLDLLDEATKKLGSGS